MSVLAGYDHSWIWIACEVVVLPVDLRFCERLVVC